MNYGLYLSASGVMTNLYRQDVLANNLANVGTVGFKRDVPSIQQRAAEAVESRQPGVFRQRLLDRLGGGVLAGPQRVSLERGALQFTGRSMDVALVEANAFLVVAVEGGGRSGGELRLTRDGRLSVDAQGRLVTAAGGYPVLDVSDQPIVLNPGLAVQIHSDGSVWQGGERVGQIQIAAARDPGRLVKKGGGFLWFEGGRDERVALAGGGLEPEHLESSAVEPVRALADLVDATREVNFNSQLMRYHDLLMDRAVNALGRVV